MKLIKTIAWYINVNDKDYGADVTIFGTEEAYLDSMKSIIEARIEHFIEVHPEEAEEAKEEIATLRELIAEGGLSIEKAMVAFNDSEGQVKDYEDEYWWGCQDIEIDDPAEALKEAARAVINSWEDGDLALAVRELDAALDDEAEAE